MMQVFVTDGNCCSARVVLHVLPPQPRGPPIADLRTAERPHAVSYRSGPTIADLRTAERPRAVSNRSGPTITDLRTAKSHPRGQ